MRGAVSTLQSKAAFTLAEVLIVLGVIGVVAALTIPGMIRKQRNAMLEAAFKKCDAQIQTLKYSVFNEVGVNSIKQLSDLCNVGTNDNLPDCKNEYQGLFDLINSTWSAKLSEQSHVTLITDTEKLKMPIKSYVGSIAYNYYYQLYAMGSGVARFQNGCTVSRKLLFYYHGFHDGVYYSFDTNGPENGPNRWGYDIFTTSSDKDIWGWNNRCQSSIETETGENRAKYNGRGCYGKAKKDKDYFKNLK